MAIFSVRSTKPFVAGALVSVLAVGMAACGPDEEVVPEEPVDPQEVVNIGVTMSSPGLISGTEPAEVSGLEVELATIVAQGLETAPDNAEIRWVPVTSDQVAEAFAAHELDLVIGQLPGPDLTDDLAWLGPYVTTQAGLLTVQEPADTEDTADAAPFERLSDVESVDDVADATVCVVDGSLADTAALPVAETVVQQTVTECETGLRSGRYDAVAADAVQLAGVLADPMITTPYELVYWSDLQVDDEDESDDELPEELLASGQYWIGVSQPYCADASAVFQELIADGTVAELVNQWAEPIDVQPEPVTSQDLVAPECVGTS